MATSELPIPNFDLYICPRCRGALATETAALYCRACQATYPLIDGIPDFIPETLTRAADPFHWRLNDYYSRHARTYELTRYPLRLFLYGGLEMLTFKKLIALTVQFLDTDRGLVLDAACGPGTLGRRLASPERIVYGVDLSMPMLRQGRRYVSRPHLEHVHFARARVERLPFRAGQFDGALCGAALKLFADPAAALQEIGRTLKAGAPLAGSTVIDRPRGVFRYRWFRDNARRQNIHLFKLSELETQLAQSGFTQFQYHTFGAMILFGARKERLA